MRRRETYAPRDFVHCNQLDGYIADLNGGVSWLDSGADAENTEDGYEAFLQKIDTVVMGYNTYRQVAEELSPGKWVYSGMMSYVLTHRKMDDLPEIRFVHQNVGRLLQRLKQQEGRDIWLCGGANVVGQCLEQDLIDEFHITMIPILLGRGIPLFWYIGPFDTLETDFCEEEWESFGVYLS